MLPSRYAPPQAAAARKSRLEGRPSYLPKPRHAGSIDRLSADYRRPSNARSSSAEAPRVAISGVRLSREASATKMPLNRHSRSQQGESSRYGQPPVTPLRSSLYSRSATTPVRTPSDDHSNRSWERSLDRALAFVTMKDQRQISNAAWQRATLARASAALVGRGSGPGAALLRPLTITRFVEVTGALLQGLMRAQRLDNDNYVVKVPHIAKMLLYPGAVSKSWLKTVNTLHAFPHALALVAYLLDLLERVEAPVEEAWLYADKEELAALRRDYLLKCWHRFQDPSPTFTDLDTEYLQSLRQLLGDDEARVAELRLMIKNQECALEDPEEAAAAAEERGRADRRAALLHGLRAERGARVQLVAGLAAARAAARQLPETASVDAEIERANAELAQLRAELEAQTMSVERRAALLHDAQYSRRVAGSKQELLGQLAKMLSSKEAELAVWQEKTLASCLEYKKGLIRLAAATPSLERLTIDEKELMQQDCLSAVTAAVTSLRALVGELKERERCRAADGRRRALAREETQTKIDELRTLLAGEQESLAAERAAAAAAAAAARRGRAARAAQLEGLAARQAAAGRVHDERAAMEAQRDVWRAKLASLQAHVRRRRAAAAAAAAAARARRAGLLRAQLAGWQRRLDDVKV